MRFMQEFVITCPATLMRRTFISLFNLIKMISNQLYYTITFINLNITKHLERECDTLHCLLHFSFVVSVAHTLEITVCLICTGTMLNNCYSIFPAKAIIINSYHWNIVINIRINLRPAWEQYFPYVISSLSQLGEYINREILVHCSTFNKRDLWKSRFHHSYEMWICLILFILLIFDFYGGWFMPFRVFVSSPRKAKGEDTKTCLSVVISTFGAKTRKHEIS